jgi:multidrug transporter EmrE-like cation transporter
VMSDFAKNMTLLGAYVGASSVGLLLLKGSLDRIRAASGALLPVSQDMILMAVGLVLYIISFGLWVGVLARMPVSTAFPLAIGLTLALATTGASVLLGEGIGLVKLAGVLLIFAGCVAVNLSPK